MTPLRAGVVLMALCAICLVVVMLRAERVRLEARSEAHFSTLVETRRRIWNLQAELARLRAPEEVRRRALRVEPSLCRTHDEAPTKNTSRQVADNRF